MKTALIASFAGLLCLAASILGSCGGSTTVAGGGGISGTGTTTIAVGQATDFGSVWIGSSEYFARPGSRIFLSFDNVSTSQESVLHRGMSITVAGGFNAAANRLEYDRIDYRPELRGPLADVDLAGSSCTLLGRQVRATSDTLYAGGLTSLGDLAAIKGQQPEIEVSGNITDNGELVASRIALIKQNFTAGSLVALKGTVSNPTSTSFDIGSQSISLTGATFINMLPGDLAPGLFLEVMGNYNGTTIAAQKIERRFPLNGAVSGTKLELRGLALSTVAPDNSLLVAGPDGPVQVQVTSDTRYRRGGTMADKTIVNAGIIVEVKGTLQTDNRTLTASDINAESPG